MTDRSGPTARRATASKAARPQQPRSTFARVARGALIALAGLLVLGVVGAAVLWVATPIPDPNKDFTTANTHLLYRDGKTELGVLSVQNREQIPYAQMPQTAKDAIVAGENPTFWTDPGISIAGIARALTTLTSGADAQGGSTITQQYVKILYLTQERTLTRKLREMVIALKLGQEVSKEQILEGYLNTVYYGRGAYGIQAAAKAYFDKDAAKLTLPESVVLMALVNGPGKMDPALGEKQAQNLLERYQYILNKMVESGKITDAQRAPIYYQLPAFPAVKKDPRFGGTDGYLMKVVIDELKSAGFDEASINGGGLTVTTTFDKTDQDAAVAAAQAKVKEAAASSGQPAAQLHASVVAIDNASGGVLAMYGGNNDYVTSSRNWATTARPTGSTFKTWALVAALRQGVPLDKELKGYTFTAADGQSVSGETSGMVTLRQATTDSINSAYVDLVTQLTDGPANVIKAATDAGAPQGPGWDATIRLPMGTAEVSPVDNASAYSTLANDGVRRPWHVVAKVTDRSGAVLYAAPTAANQVIQADIAKAATDCLKEVATSGTGRVVGDLGWPVAGKTGTRYDGVKTTSSWFVGYTKQITTAVNYVAGDTGQAPLDPYSNGFYGAGYPARTWLAFMQVAMKGLPQQPLGGSTYTPSQTPTQTVPPTTATPTPTRTTATVAPTTTVAPPPPTTTTTTTTTSTSAPAPTRTSTSTTTRPATTTTSATPAKVTTP